MNRKPTYRELARDLRAWLVKIEESWDDDFRHAVATHTQPPTGDI